MTGAPQPRLFEWHPICIDKPCIGKIDICPCDDECDSVKQCVEHAEFLKGNPEVAKRNAEVEIHNFEERMRDYARSRPVQPQQPDALASLKAKVMQRQMDVETEEGAIIEVIEKGEVLAWIEEATIRQKQQEARK